MAKDRVISTVDTEARHGHKTDEHPMVVGEEANVGPAAGGPTDSPPEGHDGTAVAKAWCPEAPEPHRPESKRRAHG